MDILFEDNHLLALNKEAGLLTQPSGTDSESLEGQGKSLLQKLKGKHRAPFLHAVHRLDRPASGIVLFAKTQKALSRLQGALREKRFEKSYLALIEGSLPALEGSLEHFLVKGDRRAELALASTPGARRSLLHYRVLGYPLVEIELVTGRYHQIRAQLAACGSPIYGDRKYGSEREYRRGAIALHHHRLVIPHPISGERISLLAPLPEGFVPL